MNDLNNNDCDQALVDALAWALKHESDNTGTNPAHRINKYRPDIPARIEHHD